MSGDGWRWGIAVMVVSAAAWACSVSSGFLCSGSDECSTGGGQGVCEATGFCSFPDESCASGRRYGSLAGGLSDSCVLPDDGGTSDGSAGSASSTTGSTTSNPLTDSTTGGDSTGSGTTDGVGETSNTGGSTGDSAGGSTGGSTGGTTVFDPADVCGDAVVFFDDFEDGQLDGWDSTASGGATIEESNGKVALRIDQEDVSGPASASISTSTELELVDVFVRADIDRVNDLSVGSTWFAVAAEGGSWTFQWSSDATLRTTFWTPEETVVRTSIPYAIEDHRWFQFVVTGSTIRWEVSNNGEDWTLLDSETLVEPLSGVPVVFGTAISDIPMQEEGRARMSRIFVCGLPSDA